MYDVFIEYDVKKFALAYHTCFVPMQLIFILYLRWIDQVAEESFLRPTVGICSLFNVKPNMAHIWLDNRMAYRDGNRTKAISEMSSVVTTSPGATYLLAI